MSRLTLLHTNDIHGRIAGLARVATLVDRIKQAHPDDAVVWMDAGDSEETSVRLSNLTKGVAMHRLLTAAGCSAVTVGNAALGLTIWRRYRSAAGCGARVFAFTHATNTSGCSFIVDDPCALGCRPLLNSFSPPGV